ncbi:transglycosylase SLT domain-containing protein [Streptomyces sp. NBC_00233]|uniref:transglycosylase SLT domain-containing protein n=1 Tax=Streptomyces sp. NBC_00233 TaxID=2975686 RepID=UPI0022576FBC|nr:transglycosylase SLT domain-containing protein [Streptomyces sp. NBC_00233]MCX5233222.1 transglycosylase SLT domain-containing protein [Streptomyces sp. NBC_00233]
MTVALAGLSLTVGTTVAAAPQASAAPAGKHRLDGWINHSLTVMRAKGIPGSYWAIRATIMRESSGNVYAINRWDSNARSGIPSKGLMQVIDPTFRAYHVKGTSWDIYDPIANITAACNYAWHRYGSINNVAHRFNY